MAYPTNDRGRMHGANCTHHVELWHVGASNDMLHVIVLELTFVGLLLGQEQGSAVSLCDCELSLRLAWF